MRLFLISLLSLCVVQFISAAHPDYESIKSTLTKVGEGTISLDDALEIIVGTELKTKIIKDTSQKDFHDFFFDVRHLDIFTKSEANFSIGVLPCIYIPTGSHINPTHGLVPQDVRVCFNSYSSNLSKIETKYPELYKELTKPLTSSTLTVKNGYKPSFMYYSRDKSFFADGTKQILIYDAPKKSMHIFESMHKVDIHSLVPTQYLRKEATPQDLFCSSNEGFFIDNEQLEIPIIWWDKHGFAKGFSTLDCLINSEDPSFLFGIQHNTNILQIIHITIKDNDTRECFIHSIPIMKKSEDIICMATLGCRIFLTISDKDARMVTPYFPDEHTKINFCDFSCAQAAMLYRIIQDKKNKTTIASAEEHKTIQELIPDAYKKTLKKE